jgi:hypothetical protein
MLDILLDTWRGISEIQNSITICLVIGLFLSVIAVYIVLKMRMKPEIRETDIYSYKAIDHNTTQDITTEIVKKGFEHLGDYYIKQMGQSYIISRYFIDLKGYTSLLLNILISNTNKVSNVVIELETDFEDGTRINSTNKTARSIFKRERKNHNLQYPQCPAPRLIDFHYESVEEIGSGRILKKAGREIEEYIVSDIKRELNLQIRSGLMKLDSSGRYATPTIWGAFIMTFKLWLQMFYKVLPLGRTRYKVGLYKKDKRFF